MRSGSGRRVDEQLFACASAAQEVAVVVHRSDGELRDAQQTEFVDLGGPPTWSCRCTSCAQTIWPDRVRSPDLRAFTTASTSAIIVGIRGDGCRVGGAEYPGSPQQGAGEEPDGDHDRRLHRFHGRAALAGL